MGPFPFPAAGVSSFVFLAAGARSCRGRPIGMMEFARLASTVALQELLVRPDDPEGAISACFRTSKTPESRKVNLRHARGGEPQ